MSVAEACARCGLVVFDLDECLICGADTELDRPADFRVGPYHIYRRTYLDKFPAAVTEWYEVAVWSSATSDYVGEISAEILPSDVEWVFVWARDRCTPRMQPESRETVYLKDLKKVKRLGYSLDRVLIVDDTPDKLARNYGNAIYVTPFVGAVEDDELRTLLSYLVSIRNEPDFRRVDKRRWKSHTAGRK